MMGPQKVVVQGDRILDARSGKVIQAGLSGTDAIKRYANQHYIVLPEVDRTGKPWNLNGQPVYCIRGIRYETLDDHQAHLARCPDCGGMGMRTEEVTVERDCIRCTQCGHEFDARLEMMES